MKNFNSLIRESNNNAAGYGNNPATTRQRHGNETPWKRLCLTILALLTLSIGQVWAGPTFSGGYAYFYNKGGWSDSYKQLCIGKSSYTSTYSMTAITNTKLWYVSLPTSGWGDATYMAVIGNSSSWGSGDWGPSNLSNANHRTGTVDLGNWGFNSGNVNMLTPANGNNDATLTLSYVGNAYSSLNNTITFRAKAAVNSSTYSDVNTPAKLTASSKAFSSYTSCETNKSATLNAGSTSTTISCGYTATTTLTAADADGYDFIGWYDSSGNQVTTSKTLTIYPTEATTYYAYYKTYEVKVATITTGGTATPTSWTKMSPTNGGAITATPSTGYTFSGWSILSGGGGYFGATGTATTSSTANTVFRPTKSSSLKATFTAKTYTVTLDKNGGSSGGSATATYNSNTLTINTEPARASYEVEGYYTEGGTKVANADGSLVSGSISGYTTSGNWTKDDNATLYTHWTYNPVTHTVNFGVRSGQSALGSVTAKNTSTEPATNLTSGDNVESGSSIQVTATPADHYKLEGWYNAASGGSLIAGAGTTNPYTYTLSGNTSTYASFVQKTTTVTLKKNDGTSASTDITATHGSTLPSFTVHSRTGYTLKGYYTNSSGGTKIINADKSLVANVTDYTTSASKWDYDDATLDLYAQWEEKLTTVTINVDPASTGTLTVGGAAFTPGNTTTAGVSTSRTVVATAANDYAFSSWSVTGNATGTNSTNTYTLKGNGSAGTGTLTANFTLIPCKLYKVSAAKNGSTTDKGAMTYDAIEHAYYKDITTDASPYYFRFYYNSSAQYCTDWSSKAGGDAYTSGKQITANDSKVACDQSVGGWGDKPAMYYPGESGTAIRIWFDFQNKKVWITADKDKQYVLRGANADDTSLAHGMPGWNATTSYFDGLASGNTGTYDATLNADEWYHLKVYDMYNSTWYGTTGSEAQLNDGVYGTMGSGNNFYFHTTIAGSYTFTLDKSSGTKIKIDFPASYQLNYSIGSVAGTSGTISSSPSTATGSYVVSGNTVTLTAPAAKTGFTWKGWYLNADGSGAQQCATQAYAITMNANKTVYACYNENTYNVTVSAGANGSVSPNSTVAIKQVTGTSLTATPNTGYYLTEWTKVGSAINLSSTTDNTITATTTAGGAGYSITANFAPIWAILGSQADNVSTGTDGFGGWNPSNTTALIQNISTSAGKTYGYVELTLEANKDYQFKMYDRQTGSWYGNGGDAVYYMTASSHTDWTFGTDKSFNCGITTGAPGTYRFTWNLTDKKMTVTYPSGYTVTFSANTLSGTGDGASSAPTATYNSGATSITSGDYVPASTSVTFTAAAAKSGYTFNGWYTATTGGTKKSSNLSYSETITDNTTRYARYTQNTHTVTLTNDNTSQGTVNTSSPVTVGEAEAVQIQATPKTDYMFRGWVKTAGSGTVTYYTGAGAGQVEDASGNTKATTYITVTGDVTLKATWDDDRWSGYYVHYGNDGKNADGNPDASQTRPWNEGNLYKKADEMAGTVSYFTFTASAADVNKVIEFKIVKYSPDTWYGYNAAGGGKITASITDAVLNTSYGNGRLCIVTPGDYVFKWDSNGNKLSITYPAGNYIRGDFNSWGWDHALTPTGNANEYSATISLTGANAEHLWSPADHGFKVVIGGVHYGKNSTIIAPNANSAAGCATNGSNIGLATTIGGNYVFTYNTSTNTVTVTYPTVTAMTGTVGLTMTGHRSGSGTELNPYSVYEGDEITISKTHTSAPANDSHFKYTYYTGEKNASTATTELATRLSTAGNTSYTFTVNQEVGKYPLKVAAYYEYGPDGYKVKGTAQESGIVYFRVHLAPEVELTADKTSITDGQTVTLTATPNHLEVHGINVKYEFFRGNSTADVDKISETTKTVTADNAPTATQVVTPDCSGDANNWTYTVRMTYLGITKTTTVTVYRKWDIYVNDVCGWGAMKLYNWDGSGAYPVAFPGTAQPLVDGSTHWYKVTLDARYPNFKLSKQSGTESNNHIVDHATYLPGTYWYLNNCQTLTKVTISTPTVTISATVTEATKINLTGNITDFGGDDTKASKMKEVYFNVNGSKDATGVTASDSHTFTKTLNNPTASASPANTLQAAATNIAYTGSSSTLNFTNVTLDMQSGASGTAAVLAVNGVAMASGATAPTRTGYTFGGYFAAANGSGTQYYNADMTSATNWDQTTATKTLYAKWTANTYSVHFDGNGATSGEMADETGFTYDVSKALTANAFERTGYTFQGWATAHDGAKVYNDGQNVSNLSSTNGATVTLYAVWQAKTYLVTLDKRAGTTGYRSSGTWANPTVTYDATPTTMSGTAPGAADGYGFMGFYTETDGGGLQLIDKTGAWQASKEGYTDASAHWIHDGAVTVYAYYKQAEIITLNFVASIVQPSSTVQVTPVVEPAPEGNTHIEWRILYDNNNPLDPQPAKTTYNTTGIQFTSSASSGSYKVEATLKTGLVEGAGTALSTKAVAFQVAGEHTITVKYVSGSYTIQPATEAPGLPLDWTSITAPTLTGYTFSRWVAGEGITIETPADPGTPSIATTATIRYKAIYDGVLTAEYTKKRLIYFYNTLGWSDVNVYFYKNNSYWGTASQGTGANTSYAFTNTPYSEGLHGQMLPIAEGSNIYYFDAEAAGVNASYTTVAFTELAQHGSDYFYNHNKVIRRDDYKSTTLPMFVPLAEQEAVHMNGGAADYYNKGYWMNYPENTGYTLKIYNNAYADKATGVVREFAFPFSDDKKMPLKMDVEFNDNGTHEYWFMVYRNDGTYLGNTYVFNQNYNAEQIITGGENKSKLITSAPGKYNFMLTYHDNGSGTTNYYIDVDFPIAVGDYRIVYQDNATWSLGEHTASWNHPSDVINKIAGDATEAKKDTVSFFVAKGTDIIASMKFQYASAINETTGAITWTDVTGGSITIPTDVVTEAGVYNFIVSQPVGGASIALEKAEPYTGNFYIRTDIAGNTKWDSYKANDHLMQYSDYAAENENFTHYYAHWVERNTNIKFVIANDYSPCISDTLVEDVDDDFGNMVFDDVKKEYTGTLKSQWPDVQDPTFDRYSANIRFMYNEKTNKISRAYVSGSSNIGKFIIMHGASTAPKIYDENGAELAISGLDPNSINLVDDQNFIYETTIMANPTTRIKLTAEYSGVVQRFKGDDKEGDYTEGHAVEILGGTYTSASIKEKMRVIYDFKTNRLVCAWLPSGEIDGHKVIDADVMIIREHQGDAQQISFRNNNDDLSGVKYVYGVMRFNRWDLANKDRNTHKPLAVGASIYERRMYFISFPFDVNLGDIFGLGRYDDHWWIQYYDGADRANKGFFQESTTFWKFMENTKDAKLKANEGYILTLGSEMLRSDNMDIWVNEINQVELFFPSADMDMVNTIEKTDATVTLEELPCTINHNTVEPGQPGYIPDIDRRKRDSHWHCMGVPSYANYSSYLKDGSGNNITWSTWSSESFPFLYVWNMQDNTLTPTATGTYGFKTMHAYMVQAYGNIEWKATSVIPSSVAARRNADYTDNYMFRLNLMTGGKEAGRTFINLRDDEKVTNNFDFNYDLSNEGGAIYTTTGDFVNVAGNCLPLETEQLTVIPVGVVAKTAGEYTFAMPDGTEGLNVVLFDSQENIHTDLSLTDYTVELPAGTYDNRFYLTIDPRKTTTSIDLVGGEGSEMAPRKVFVNGLMYIIRGNDVYDANGRKLK